MISNSLGPLNGTSDTSKKSMLVVLLRMAIDLEIDQAASTVNGTHITLIGNLTTTALDTANDAVTGISDGTDGYLYYVKRTQRADNKFTRLPSSVK